ncbi:TPA: type I-B CRISPR-associated protein Cas5, partial [Clostridioides difficile]|nr:type I-B CRISPR-associated protein Cas5 [Clostridioides difficile]
MEVLKFNLSGKTAFFKKPDVNSIIYFTYGNIHKIALMGILGACLGLGGYNQQSKEDEYPEFYSLLKDIKMSIVPKHEFGYINKKVHIFNNSVGYASKEEGGNLIIKEQWLENVSWDIYIQLEDSTTSRELKRRFLSNKFVYIPYLGKNDHIANISEIEIITDFYKTEDINRVDSFFIREDFEFEKSYFDDNDDYEEPFKYQEKLPYRLHRMTNQYILETIIFTNMSVKLINKKEVYQVKGLN